MSQESVQTDVLYLSCLLWCLLASCVTLGSHLTPLGLCFLICVMGRVNTPFSKVV